MTVSRIVALLDVDETLIIGNYVIDPDVDRVQQIKAKLRVEGVLNQDLLSALKAAGITNVYLFTDMTFNTVSLLERRALIQVLQENGFIVHGVMTPADCYSHLPQARLKAFADSTDSHLIKKIDISCATELELFSDALHRNEDYVALEEFHTKTLSAPGQAFMEAEIAMLEQKFFEPHANTKIFADIQSIFAKLSHVKGLMFRHLINHPGQGFTKFIVCDDREDALASIAQVNNASRTPVDVITIVVNKKATDKAAYLKEINAPYVLHHACVAYKNHLEKFLTDDLARKKLNAVNEIHATLSKTMSYKQLQAFQNKLNEYRATLEQRRDTYTSWFLKVIATVFSLGLVAALGIWKVTGKQLTKTADAVLPTAYTPTNTSQTLSSKS